MKHKLKILMLGTALVVVGILTSAEGTNPPSFIHPTEEGQGWNDWHLWKPFLQKYGTNAVKRMLEAIILDPNPATDLMPPDKPRVLKVETSGVSTNPLIIYRSTSRELWLEVGTNGDVIVRPRFWKPQTP